MTKDGQLQEVREAIAKIIDTAIEDWDNRNNMSGFFFPAKYADQILSLKHPDNSPMLAVLDRDQSLPNNLWFKNCCIQRKKPAKICLVCPFIDYKTGNTKAEFRRVIL